MTVRSRRYFIQYSLIESKTKFKTLSNQNQEKLDNMFSEALAGEALICDTLAGETLGAHPLTSEGLGTETLISEGLGIASGSLIRIAYKGNFFAVGRPAGNIDRALSAVNVANDLGLAAIDRHDP